jgi:hypothetical protein
MGEAAHLTHIFDNNGGEQWVEKHGWATEGIPVREWYGVEESEEGVHELNLELNNVSGE